MSKISFKVIMFVVWMSAISSGRGGSLGETPSSFFTNLAEHLLQSQLNLSLARIQVSPTNQYTPAVHRLLQVAANIYDSTTNHFDSTCQLAFPSVFKPLFMHDSSGIFICGYTNDNDASTAQSWFANSPEGIPLIIGVKKGLPNFNEFVFQTFGQFTRKLEVGRPRTNSPPNQTNQIILLSLSHSFGVETWNSYPNAFSNSFQIYVSNVCYGLLSNAVDGFTLPLLLQAGKGSTVLAGTNGDWHFSQAFPARHGYTAGFMVPLYTNVVSLSNARYNGTGFDSMTNSFLPRTGQLADTDWRLILSNHLTYIMSSEGRIVDAVSLTFQTNLNLASFGQNRTFAEPSAVASLWDTNRITDPSTGSTPTRGIVVQLGISLGNPQLSAADWRIFNAESNDKTVSIANFQAFFRNSSTSNLFQQAPFAATRRFVHTVTWQANDPLVHYTPWDLSGITNELRFLRPNEMFTNNVNLGRLNQRYQPWLGNPLKNSDVPDSNDSYPGIKDPGVFGSDDWTFPTNLLANAGLLGHVHRGTPWQTIYLKAEVADPAQWLIQSPDIRTHPTNDWKIAGLVLSLLNTNDPRNLFSINQTSEMAWENILGGMTVLSNTLPTIAHTSPTNFDYLFIDPNSPQAETVAAGIDHTRSLRTPQYFRQVGDILATPELSTQSPYLNLNGDPASGYSAQDIQTFGFTDEVYEKIPEQLLPLLRADPILFLSPMNGRFQARATGFRGYSYALESSSDLQSWRTLVTQFAESDTFEFPKSLDPGVGKAFYRARLLP